MKQTSQNGMKLNQLKQMQMFDTQRLDESLNGGLVKENVD